MAFDRDCARRAAALRSAMGSAEVSNWRARDDENDRTRSGIREIRFRDFPKRIAENASTAAELRPALRQERRDALAKIVGARAFGKTDGFGVELLVERTLRRRADQSAQLPVGAGRSLREPLHQLPRLALERIGGHHPIAQSEAKRLCRIDGLAQQRQLERAMQSDDARQRPRGGTITAGADQRIGDAEARALGSDDQIGTA